MTDIKTRIYVYVPGEAVTEREIDLPKDPGYARLSTILDPEFPDVWWEHVSVLFKGRLCDMFVDEAGRLKNLPVNRAATEIYHAAAKLRGEDMSNGNPIVGKAVLFDRQVWF